MNKYWKAVLLEVLKQDGSNSGFCYTSLGEIRARSKRVKRSYSRAKKPITMYALGEMYTGIYLTRREAECMRYFLQGKTIVGAAEQLNLSPRTVEFYVKNMKIKLDCATKDDLVRKVRETDFLKNFDITKG